MPSTAAVLKSDETPEPSLIYLAALDAYYPDAEARIVKALGIGKNPDAPEPRQWMLASYPARMILIGEWIRSQAYLDADSAENGRREFRPVGGDKYASQND